MGEEARPSAGRVHRRRRGATSGATLSTRPTFRVRGEVYNRLRYIGTDRLGNLLGTDGSPQWETANLFQREQLSRVQGEEMADYGMCSWEDRAMAAVELEMKRGTRILESVETDTDGTFSFRQELSARTNYTLELLFQGNRIPSERIRYRFSVPRVPREDTERVDVQVRSTHEIQGGGSGWTQVDRETFTATLRGGPRPILWFAGPGVLVVNTFALEVDHISQHLSDRYCVFPHRGRRWAQGLEHLCLATSAAMTLRYYGLFTEEEPERTVGRVVMMAAQWCLDHQSELDVEDADGRPVSLDTTQTNPDGRPMVRLGEAWPHNSDRVVCRALRPVLDRASRGGESCVGGGSEDLMTVDHPKLTNIFGLGMPVILADSLSGRWEHARLCRGIVVTHEGEVVRAYVNDPGHPERLDIPTDGSGSDLGWALLGCLRTQGAILDTMLGGTRPPASRRSSGLYA